MTEYYQLNHHGCVYSLKDKNIILPVFVSEISHFKEL